MSKGIKARMNERRNMGIGHGLSSIRSLTDAIREEEQMLGSHSGDRHKRQQRREETLPSRNSYTPVQARTGQAAAHRVVEVFVKVGAGLKRLSDCKQATLPPGIPATRS